MRVETLFSRRNSSEANSIFSRESHLMDDLRFLREVYGVKVKMGRMTSQDYVYLDSLKKINLHEAERHVGVIRTEIEKYPPEFVKKLGLETIRLVKNIKLKGERRVAGLACYNL